VCACVYSPLSNSAYSTNSSSPSKCGNCQNIQNRIIPKQTEHVGLLLQSHGICRFLWRCDSTYERHGDVGSHQRNSASLHRAARLPHGCQHTTSMCINTRSLSTQLISPTHTHTCSRSTDKTSRVPYSCSLSFLSRPESRPDVRRRSCSRSIPRDAARFRSANSATRLLCRSGALVSAAGRARLCVLHGVGTCAQIRMADACTTPNETGRRVCCGL